MADQNRSAVPSPCRRILHQPTDGMMMFPLLEPIVNSCQLATLQHLCTSSPTRALPLSISSNSVRLFPRRLSHWPGGWRMRSDEKANRNWPSPPAECSRESHALPCRRRHVSSVRFPGGSAMRQSACLSDRDDSSRGPCHWEPDSGCRPIPDAHGAASHSCTFQIERIHSDRLNLCAGG